jgi:hypothetical protein
MKEAMLIWQLWHKAVTVNVWRRRINNYVNQSYPMCNIGEKESVLHSFWSCDYTQLLWEYNTVILNRLAKSPPLSS